MNTKRYHELFDLFLERVTLLTKCLICLLMIAIIINISADIFFRYVLVKPLSWSSQLAKYLMVWFAFLGSSLAFRSAAHLNIDLLIKNLSLRWRKILFSVSYLGITFFLCVVIILGFQFSYGLRFDIDPLVGIKMIYPFLGVPVGSIFMLIQLTGVLSKILREKG